MKNPIFSAFIYPYAFKYLGIGLIILGLLIFMYRISAFGIFDLAGFSFPVAFGLVLIFFSKEKLYDERIAYLKFKALAVAIPATAVLVSLVNYYFNYYDYSVETDSWYSISAFEFLTVTMTLAIGWFYYLKLKE